MTLRTVMYAQCHLTRTDPDGSVWHTVGFIPARFAVVGKRVSLTINNVTRDNWIVAGAGKRLFPNDLIQEQSRDYKRMRKASDI